MHRIDTQDAPSWLTVEPDPHIKRNDDVAPALNRHLRLPSSAAEVCILSATPGGRRLTRKFLLPGAVALVLAGCAAANTPPLALRDSLQPPLHDPKLFPSGSDFARATPAEARQFCNEGYSIWCPHARDSQPQPAPAAAAPAPVVDPYALGGAPKETPVSINGAITLDFTIDSGATDVSIPADVVLRGG
jgi:hypothetical protein